MSFWNGVTAAFYQPPTGNLGFSEGLFVLTDAGMVQRENYWVPADDSLVVDFVDHPGRCQHGTKDPDELLAFGAPGVRVGCSPFWHPDCEVVVLTFGGHHSEGKKPSLLMSRDMAMELAKLLVAAVIDEGSRKGNGRERVQFTDRTAEPCGCERAGGERS